MAAIIPKLSTLRRLTPGERRFGQRLEALLEDDYLVWYDVPVGKQRRYPDFIVLHPGRGLLFLEVKDWKLEQIQSMAPDRVTLQTNKGRKILTHPLEQARQYAHSALKTLEGDPQLIQHDGRYQGRLCFPYGYGVVFTAITREQWSARVSEGEQERLLPPHRVIFKDEMLENEDPEAFQMRLWNMFEYTFGSQLTLPQIDRIRWHLFPEVRISDATQDMFDSSAVAAGPGDSPARAPTTSLPDIVRVMDIQQEQLARSLGDGHRVIHGVAGSGKTLILGYRCLQLSQALAKPILVLCFNITLAAHLRSLIATNRVEDKVQVYHFHDWCALQLKTYNVDTLPGRQPIFERQVESVIAAVDRGQIPRAQYGAVLIDEGHDFEREWLSLVAQMVHPDSNSLLLLYDDAQSIYRKRDLTFSLSSAGIQARGRTTVLRLNYRNTREILTFAYDFAREYLQAQSDGDDDHVPLVEPEVAGASGPMPAFRGFATAQDETDYIVRCVQKWLQQGQAPGTIAIIFAHHWQGANLHAALENAGIANAWLKTSADKRAYEPTAPKVVLLTRQSSKGLEFDTVILAGVGALNDRDENLAQESRLLYVAMTRACRQLLVTASGGNRFTARLEQMAS